MSPNAAQPDRRQVAAVLGEDIGSASARTRWPSSRHSRSRATAPGGDSTSRNAAQDEKLGPVYIAAITLERSHIMADGRRVALSPGLAATVDIRTGRRSIISYLLSPLQATVEQAGRER